MPTSTNVTNLKINELTEAQYDSAVQGGVIGANELSILTDVDAGQVIQVSTLPTASADELGNIYQFIGTTDANYTNGYFYKCVSDGATPAVYSWSRVDVQPGSSLPSQTGNAGKFLTTDGTDASWSDKPLVNTDTHSYGLVVGGSNTSGDWNTVIGKSASSFGGNGNTVVGAKAQARNASTVLGAGLQISNLTSLNTVVIGSGNTSQQIISPTANTFNWYRSGTEYVLFDANVQVPSDRLVNAINKYSTMPTAASTNEGWIVQFTGTTDSTYTHGHLYECVSDGGNPATYSWTEVSMGGGLQNTATGTDSLTILGTATQKGYAINIGVGSSVTGNGHNSIVVGYNASAGAGSCVVLGTEASASSPAGIAIGRASASAANYAIQIGVKSSGGHTNSDANTFKVGNNNGNFEMMSADGTIPTARLTKVNSTITLAAADWSSNSQTVNVTGMTATGVVMVSPDPTDQSAYTSAGILCTAQAAGTLTFTCDTVPSADIDVNVVML